MLNRAAPFLLSAGDRVLPLATHMPFFLQRFALQRSLNQVFAQAMQENGLAINHDYVKHGNFKSDDGYSLTKELFKLQNPPTAIFSFNNMMTLGCLRFFTENKIIVGEEISLIGFDEIEMLDWLNIKISVVSRPTIVMGIEATELLLQRIQNQTMSTGFEKVLAVELALKRSEKSMKI